MRINLHLFGEKISTLAKAQAACKLDNYEPLELNDPDVDGYSAFIKKTRERQPAWTTIVSGLFDVPEEKTFSVSCLVLMAVEHQRKTRVFGLTFGYAHNAIPPNHIEAKFGLKVALNILAEKGLKNLASRTIDHNVKQKQLHVSVDSHLTEFGFDSNEDWLFSVEGKVKEAYQDLCKAIKGRDSVSFEFQGSLYDLSQKCKKALECYSLENYRKNGYEFIDALNEVKKDSELDVELTNQLKAGVRSRSGLRVVAAYPEVFDSTPETFELSFNHKSEEYEHVSISSIADYLEKHKDAELDRINIRAKDLDGNTISKVYSALDYLVAEIEHAGAAYVYTWGRWFKVDKDYQKITHAKLGGLTDITDTLKLPELYKTKKDGKIQHEDEESYNKRAGEQLKAVVFDKKPIYYRGNQKIEVCDILTRDDQFICVKKMNDSASMSHLFNQGVNTAYLLRGDAKFEKAASAGLGRAVNKPKASIVYGIVMGKTGQIKDELFFFSQISLLRAIKDIEGRGFSVAVAKISTKEVAELPSKKKK